VLLLLGLLAFVHVMAIPAFEDEGSQLRLVWRLIEAGEWLQPWARVSRSNLIHGTVTLLRSPFPRCDRTVYVVAGMIGAVLTYRVALTLGEQGTA